MASSGSVYLHDFLSGLQQQGLMADFLADEHGTHAAVAELAAAYGLGREQTSEEPSTDVAAGNSGDEGESSMSDTPSDTISEDQPLPPIRHWIPTRIETVGDVEQQQLARPPAELTSDTIADDIDDEKNWVFHFDTPTPPTLLQWSQLWPFLRLILSEPCATRTPDLPPLLRSISLGRPIQRLPLLQKDRWASRVWLLLDRRIDLVPYWHDYRQVCQGLEKLRGSHGLEVIDVVVDGDELRSRRSGEVIPLPTSDVTVLALGDLGQYDPPQAQAWREWGRQARARGVHTWALCPCPRDRWLEDFERSWHRAYWDHSERLPRHPCGQRPSSRHARRHSPHHEALALLRLLSPAVRVEPGLLRDGRYLLPHGMADVGTEYDALQHGGVLSGASCYRLDSEFQQQLRQSLADSQPSAQCLRHLIEKIIYHHQPIADIYGPEEAQALRLLLETACPELLDDPYIAQLLDPETIDRRWLTYAHWLYAENREGMMSYARQLLDQLPEQRRASVGQQVAWAMSHRDYQGDIPLYIERKNIAFLQPGLSQSTPLWVSVRDGLRIDDDPRWALGQLITKQTTATIQFFDKHDTLLRQFDIACHRSPIEIVGAEKVVVDTGLQKLHLEYGEKPYWAEKLSYRSRGLTAHGPDLSQFTWDIEGGQWLESQCPNWASSVSIDGCGLLAHVSVNSCQFTFRWIPPGTFHMGGSEAEKDLFTFQKNIPQHQVTISKGFWLAATPTRQDQWEAVMGQNPSKHKGAKLPVENVSWDDVQTYLDYLKKLLPGLQATLPSEAQWEYACRAETPTAYNNGTECTAPEGYDPGLDAVGWFNKNSGQRTHPVAQKTANVWGLYDMHGNVFEWCLDSPRNYATESVHDPTGSAKDSGRAIRGGSAWYPARFCRSAVRRAFERGLRFDDLGFRLAAIGQPEAQELETSTTRSRKVSRPEA